MNANDLTQFTQFLRKCCVLYGKSMSEDLIEWYWGALELFEWAKVKAAFQSHVSSPDAGKFMPMPADVLCCVQGGSPQIQALHAWSKVAQAIRRVGSYESVVFDDFIIHAVIADMGGWISLCQTLLKELPFRANDFKNLYAAYVRHPPLQYPKQLLGLMARDNHCEGDVVMTPPFFIGDIERALVVFNQGDDGSLSVQPLVTTSLNSLPSER